MDVSITIMDNKKNLLKGAYLIESSPTPAAAGLIAGSFMIEELKAEKIGEITSPYFPQISIVDNEGLATPIRIELHFFQDKSTGKKLLFMVRNFPVEGNEGSYITAKKIYDFLSSCGVEAIYCLASGRIFGSNEVYVSSTKLEHVKDFIDAGAKSINTTQDIVPIDRLTAFLLLFFARDGKKTFLLIADSPSYIPDPAAAKRLLEVLIKHLKISMDLSKLDEDIKRHEKLMESLEKTLLEHVETSYERRYTKEPFYIG